MDDIREHINKLRVEYSKKSLTEETAGTDPFILFQSWFSEAFEAKVNEVNAVSLATAAADGLPSQRIVLLRNFGPEGFVFYTNYNSKKGKEISMNPRASLLFFWPEIERQVRISGRLEKQSDAESDLYFSLRPRESQIGAWVSEQSAVISGRAELDLRYQELEKKFKGRDVPRPPHWGGYVLKATLFEFWQGRPSRLHDRIQFTLQEGSWRRERLAP